MIGDSAGAHLSALLALAGSEPQFSNQYLADRHAATSAEVKAVVGFYGVYDMLAQWEHDQIARPRDQITEKLLGGPPMLSRKVYFEASPLSYATVDKNRTRFLLVYGREDDIVDPISQSERFLTALKQAGFYRARRSWYRVPAISGAPNRSMSREALAPMPAPKMLRFLEGAVEGSA